MTKMNPEIFKAIVELINYCWGDEEKHWEESDKPRNHIFVKIHKIQQWINSIKNKSNETTNQGTRKAL